MSSLFRGVARKLYHRGVLILEVLVAIVILTGSLLVVFGVFPQAVTANQQGKGLLLATNLAQKEMEACKAMGFSVLASAATREVRYEATVRGVAQVLDFKVQREVLDTPDGLKEVAVNVTWEDKVGKHSTSLVTLVGETP